MGYPRAVHGFRLFRDTESRDGRSRSDALRVDGCLLRPSGIGRNGFRHSCQECGLHPEHHEGQRRVAGKRRSSVGRASSRRECSQDCEGGGCNHQSDCRVQCLYLRAFGHHPRPAVTGEQDLRLCHRVWSRRTRQIHHLRLPVVQVDGRACLSSLRHRAPGHEPGRSGCHHRSLCNTRPGRYAMGHRLWHREKRCPSYQHPVEQRRRCLPLSVTSHSGHLGGFAGFGECSRYSHDVYGSDGVGSHPAGRSRRYARQQSERLLRSYAGSSRSAGNGTDDACPRRPHADRHQRL